MKNHFSICFLCFLLFFCTLIFLNVNISWSADETYPVKVNVITKNQADYETPENTLAAGFFALMYNDLDWYYETLTEESAIEDKAMFEKAGIELSENFKLINPGDQLFILDKKPYKNGILIYNKGITSEGTIYTGPNVFVLENGLWKETFDYASDEEIHEYFDVAPSEEIFNVEIRLFPNHWNYQWYQKMLNKKPKQHGLDFKKVSVLCVLGNLKDSDGNLRGVEEIDPETVVLNYVVKPLPWNKRQKNKSAVLIKNSDSNRIPGKSFKKWEQQHQIQQYFKGSLMLIRFNKFETISSLDNPDDEKTYTVSVSGKLRDNETHFRGETQITLIPNGFQGKQDKSSRSPAVEDLFIDHWWDQTE